MLTFKVTAKTHGATLLARKNNAGAWRKIQSVRDVDYGQRMIDLITISFKENAIEEMTAYVATHPNMSMRVSIEEAVSKYRSTAEQIESEF